GCAPAAPGVTVTMWLFNSTNGMPRFCDACSAAMNCPWFLNPSDALSSVIVAPVIGSTGSIRVSLALRFGFDPIFCAIGFSWFVDAEAVSRDTGATDVVVAVDVALALDLDPGVVVATDATDVDLRDPDFGGFALGPDLPTVDFTGFAELGV